MAPATLFRAFKIQSHWDDSCFSPVYPMTECYVLDSLYSTEIYWVLGLETETSKGDGSSVCQRSSCSL